MSNTDTDPSVPGTGNGGVTTPRKRKGKKAAKPAVKAKRKPGRPKGSGGGPKKPRAVKLEMAAVIQMLSNGVKPADITAIQQVSEIMSTLPKRSRSRVLSALSEMFA